MIFASAKRRRYLVPEVVQTSAMDCGPATLKCLLEGFGISASYGRLREACQTDVDGTSIDTLEEVAVQLGLEAEQVVVPLDHVLLGEAQALPAIAVVCLPSGATHFVIVWGRVGRFVQVMDPATGRRWPTVGQFLDELYVHQLAVSAVEWRVWAETDEFIDPLRRRLAMIGVSASAAKALIDGACADESWRSLGALDAATRMVDMLVRAGGLGRGAQAAGTVALFYERARSEADGDPPVIPAAYWSVQPSDAEPDEEQQLCLRGAVLVRVRGRRPLASVDASGKSETVSQELAAALEETPSRPGRELLRLLRADGLLALTSLIFALCLAAAGVLFEAVLFRGFLGLGQALGLVGQRIGAISALLIFVVALMLLELPIAVGLWRLGRRLEARLRMAFLEKIPRLGERYFQSRLTSDMAERNHNIHQLLKLPELGAQFVRTLFTVVLTALGIAWLDPASWWLALLAAAGAVGLPLLVQPLLTERDLRIRSHDGALGRFYLDALLGLVSIRAHGAERAVRREHGRLLLDWERARNGFEQAGIANVAAQSLVCFGLVIWLVLANLMRDGQGGDVLLLVYWALNLPLLGQEIAHIAQQYPAHRNRTLRLLEPLGAREEHYGAQSQSTNVSEQIGDARTIAPAPGVTIVFKDVAVQAAGHTILEAIDLEIAAGSHVAIVGPSGAGKSSLVGLLLGWHRSAAGQVLIDGEHLDGRKLDRLRQETAWVDPAVQLWNRSLIDNLSYGALSESQRSPLGVIEQADLRTILEHFPDGLQTRLGEGGALVSGGEGQRIRLGRAMFRPEARLVILDEPFRGLDRQQRHALLGRTRALWRDATLLCITHDVSETQAFERVLVVEGGRVVEDGDPATLSVQAGSRYRALLEAETQVCEGLWSSAIWRRLRLDARHLYSSQRGEQA
jgi:ABC-type bacteriocin/lantibiotic exporter with double-glycine peptidase domain